MRLFERSWVWKTSTLILALAMVAACGKGKGPAPTATAASTPTQRQGGVSPSPTPTLPTQRGTATATGVLPPTPVGGQATATPVAGSLLIILGPADGSVIAGTSTTIRGQSLPEATVLVNGDLVDLAQDGSFSLDVPLEDGPNVFEIIVIGEKDEVMKELSITGSSDGTGGQSGTSNSASMSITVTDPEDGSVVSTDTVTITGRTTPGAVVLVGDQAADVDAKGGFSVKVALEQGVNVFVITAADDSNLAETEISVFYEP